uniref:Uncharacterized protein n=1 Tax=Anguilla anguilla TaxID=7936 RepID=A0A0E9PBK7_ANGAN
MLSSSAFIFTSRRLHLGFGRLRFRVFLALELISSHSSF